MDIHLAWLAKQSQTLTGVSDVRSQLLPTKLKCTASESHDDERMATPRRQIINLEQPLHYHR